MQHKTKIQDLFTALHECNSRLDELEVQIILMMIHGIASIVSDVSGIDISVIRGDSRKGDAVCARHVITIFSLQYIPGCKQKYIAQYFSRERTTVVYLYRQAQGLYDVQDPRFMSLYQSCQIEIQNFIIQS